MMSYRCWEPDAGETANDAVIVEARDRRDAAERFAKYETDYDADGYDVIDVAVEDGLGGPVLFRVVVDRDPVFTASYLRPYR